MEVDQRLLFDFLEELLGEEGVEVADIIYEKEATDEEISKDTHLRINNVRRALYKLYDNRLATYRRIKDKETGWYIYYWKMDLSRAPEIINKREKDYADHLEELLEYEKENMFFVCKNNCSKVPFDVAEQLNFKCNVCGEKLDFFDNSEMIKELEEALGKLKKVGNY
ncbi:MAG TPA: transcription factor E [Methanofastidiosum sp.]|jgi:transcription initiation factor TFIIE subunit alpha|nr:transcription factor E [Methanofastidiosum sp.]HPC81108.1 transcription factor E [Methanofastidiosum sp.]HRS25624.1 transcription factor E [Methanofastidiosum sp.]